MFHFGAAQLYSVSVVDDSPFPSAFPRSILVYTSACTCREMPNFTSIPIVDLSLASSPRTRDQLLIDLLDAITSVGFLLVKNHGVSPGVMTGLQDLLPRLFALSSQDKNQVALNNSPHFLGYSHVGSETTAGKTDLREQFEFATELEDVWSPSQPIWERLRGPNQWPTTVQDARPVIEAYMDELTRLSLRFVALVAESLSLQSDTFLPFLSGQHRMKLVRYPATDSASNSGLGVGPHKDSSGWWTFLFQASSSDVGGLQALNQLGQWIDVPNIPGTFVVNIGQAFEVVTHGYCKATTHRVLSTTKERYSVPFFQGVRRSLTKDEALGNLADRFTSSARESHEGANIDSAFLRGKYNTWGESQFRTKIRSHREVGKKFYPHVYDEYINDSQ